MSERDIDLTAFLASLKDVLASRTDGNADAMVGRVYEKLQDIGEASEADGHLLPVCEYLTPAMDVIAQEGHPLRELAGRLHAVLPRLVWRARPGPAPNASADFAESHANAMIVGPGGVEGRRDLWIGISLLAPGARYPDHDHAPPEVYLVLSPGRFLQGGGEWFSPGIGGVFYNPPGILHAMAADEDAPLLALWLLDVR